MSAPHALNPLTFPLWGSRLIEASAGTGKTWTIAALYLRLVLGHGGDNAFQRPLQPADILVMTFTRAATRELSDRIRQRLLQAAQCFRGEHSDAAPADPFLQDLMDSHPDPAQRRHAAWLLASAAEGMDEASVHTIDAWCQRMLKEHAFDSGSLFDEELLADQSALLHEACQDYWRQQCVPLNATLLAEVLGVWPNVDALHQDMRLLVDLGLTDEPSAPLSDRLGQALADLLAQLAQLKAGWADRADAMRQWLDQQTAPKVCPWDRRKLKSTHYQGWLDKLAQWANDPRQEQPDLTDPAWHRLQPDGLMEARTDGAACDLPPAFAQLSALSQALTQLPSLAPLVRRHAAARVAERLSWLKQRTGLFGFSDMQHRLAQALVGPGGAALKARILAQYPVALVDEFQDTSPLQYRIFDAIFDIHRNSNHNSLLLIGDPKQSIYGFRGADIHSYMAARLATTGRHHMLGTNHRSTAPMVAAVNHWFAQAEATQPAGAFGFRQGDLNPVPFTPVQAQGRPERFQTAQGPVAAMTVVHDLELLNADTHRARFAARCAEQIVGWLNDPQAGFEGPAGAPFRPLRPADIAVLVRTGKEALAVRRELAQRQVASVYLSEKDSVFDAPEAADLLHWLRAMATPRDERLLRAAVATSMVGLSMQELARLAHDEQAFDVWCDHALALHQVWQTQGVLSMLRQTLHRLALPARWLQAPDGERRLTNHLHLAELLQQASTELDGEQALIRWLAQHVHGDAQRSDEQIVRLESDADLVQIITVHKSKGLEFPLVLLPFAWGFRALDRQRTRMLELPMPTAGGAAPEREVLLSFSAEQLAQADQERLREDLRLLYVALTRARHGVWMGFAAQKAAQGNACVTHLSGLGRLLNGEGPPPGPEAWLERLQAVMQPQANAVLVAGRPDTACTPLQTRDALADLHAPSAYQAHFDRRWTVGSFSALVRDLASGPPLPALAQVPRPADDEPSPWLLAQTAPDNAPPEPAATEAAPWHAFPRGALAGNFLHDQLEWLAAEHFDVLSHAERLRQRCERAGHGPLAAGVQRWLQAVATQPLPGPGAALTDLQNLLPEMEFWLPVPELRVGALDTLCRQHLFPGLARPRLVARELHGMLMGFADLVFEHAGRYWVLDYKSNHLGAHAQAYHRNALQSAMAEHRYDVQAVLYLLALHRLLRQRLGAGYQPAEHLGGAVYLFLRGLDGPEHGVCLVQPPLALLDELDHLLDAGEPS